MQEIQAQQTKLNKMKSEWKLNVLHMIAEMKQKHAEIELKLEEEKKRLKMMHADMDVRVAAGQVWLYGKFEGGLENVMGERCESVPTRTATIMNLNRPLSAFADDPLKFVDFKTSFLNP